MRTDVLPLLQPSYRRTGAELLDRAMQAVASVLAHRDLGPEHLLVIDGSVSGVIDWTDAAPDDPASDLAWTLHGTPDGFREGLILAYDPTPDQLRRSLDWHRLGPWHEVLWGLDEGGPAYVESGLQGVHHRLVT